MVSLLSWLTADEHSMTQNARFADNAAATVLDQTNAELTTALAAGGSTTGTILKNAIDGAVASRTGEGASYRQNAATQLAQNGKLTYNIPITSAFFNIDKYFPLLLTEQGLDLYFYLEDAHNVGVWSAAAGNTQDYEITDVRYVAHEVNLDDAFVNQMKASMQATGGVLSLSSTTYKYNNVTGVGKLDLAAAESETLNISCRVKSLKGMLVRPQAQAINNRATSYCVGTGQSVGINSAQFRIGSVLYPQSAINFSNTNKGELFNEIRKCFGTIGSYAHGTSLNATTFKEMDVVDCEDEIVGTGTTRQSWVLAYDFETFAKSATESGINVADRALPVSLELRRGG